MTDTTAAEQWKARIALVEQALAGANGPDQERIAVIGMQWLATILAKNSDYGSSAWQTPLLAPECSPGAAIRVRMSDKVRRLERLLTSHACAQVAESIDDTLGDLGAYCLLELARPGREPSA